MAKQGPIPTFQDDQLLQGMARRVTADIQQNFSREKLERLAASDERVRLARELHDGLLQSLTAATLQLQALSKIVDKNPRGAQQRLRYLEAMIAEEQHELRTWIGALGPSAAARGATSNADLASAIGKLCQRAEAQWNVGVTLELDLRAGVVPRTLGDEIYRLVQEGLNNVGRHSGARRARVEVEIAAESVRVMIGDDGHGFPFHGVFSLAELEAAGRGPMSLRQRVASLRGRLDLSSQPTGSRVTIDLALPRQR